MSEKPPAQRSDASAAPPNTALRGELGLSRKLFAALAGVRFSGRGMQPRPLGYLILQASEALRRAGKAPEGPFSIRSLERTETGVQ